MASNRPLFDDEDLPNWLKAAGITFGGQKGTRPPSPASQPQVGSDDMSWISDERTDQAAPGVGSAGADSQGRVSLQGDTLAGCDGWAG